MNTPNEAPSLDALAAAVAARLAGQLPANFPGGEPDPELPPVNLPPYGGAVPRPDFQIGAQVVIAGVEFTQSTQFNGTATPGYGPDNSVPLVAYKTLVARVYPTVRRGAFGGDALTGTRVTGELTLSIGNRVLYRAEPSRPDGARLGPTTKIDRTLWDQELTVYGTGGVGKVVDVHTIVINCPLNFIVPAYFCRVGRIYATVRLWPVADGPMTSRGATATQYLQFLDVPAPKVCLVRVNWTDSAGNVNKPTDAQMLATTNLAERMLPFPYFETTILGTEVNSTAAFSPPATNGGCNRAWSALVASLNITRIFTALFQLGDIVYGMVPAAAIPAGTTSVNAGCGKGAGGGFIGFNPTFAHEVGHLYGRSHVAVAGDTTSDTSYPNYGGSKTSIGEVGVDTGTSPPTLFDPANTGDIMSYTNANWISPYTYQAILDARAMHQTAPIDPKRLRSILVIAFKVHRAGLSTERIEVKMAGHIQAAGMPPAPAADAVSPVSIDILDGNQRVLATHHCMYSRAHASGCGCGCRGGNVPLDREPWLEFAEAVEWPGEQAAAIAFNDRDGTFQTVQLGEPPRVEIEGPERGENSLRVRVRTEHPRERVSVVVLFTADNGETWQPIAIDPPDGVVEVSTNNLPGGEQCRFRAIATAELRSAEAETETFQLPRTPRRLIVDVPDDPCCTRAAGPVALRALIDTRGLGAVPPHEIRWSSNLDGELGSGYAISPYLSAGRHELTVTAPSGFSDTLSERAIIIVSG